LAANHLADAYEKLFARSKYKMSLNKKMEAEIDFQFCLSQSQGEGK
jgi:hypothetical protein